ncbi:MAG: DMT family transporter [Pseudomonadota bacterium]
MPTIVMEPCPSFMACAVYDGLLTKAADYSATVWLSAGYLGMFGTVLGFTWFYEAVQGIGATRAAVFTCFVPIIAILCGWLMLGEQLTVSLFMGTFLVLSGVRLVNRV